jgi:hypothetical protein
MNPIHTTSLHDDALLSAGIDAFLFFFFHKCVTCLVGPIFLCNSIHPRMINTKIIYIYMSVAI